MRKKDWRALCIASRLNEGVFGRDPAAQPNEATELRFLLQQCMDRYRTPLADSREDDALRPTHDRSFRFDDFEKAANDGVDALFLLVFAVVWIIRGP